jgi:polysaccharide export outer membrane protein
MAALLAAAFSSGCGGRKTLSEEVAHAGEAPQDAATVGEEGEAEEATQSEEERRALREIAEFTEGIAGDYKIGLGDRLDIVFYGDSTLDRKVIVRPDGKISFPRVGDIPAAGLTPAELSAAISELYAEFLKEPEATVIVDAIGTQQVYVLGEVASPGAVAIQGHLSLSQALAGAGGWSTTGQLGSVMVVRRGAFERPRAVRIDFKKVLSGDHLGYDIPLRPFDIVYVPQTVIGDAGDFADNLFSRFIVPPLNAIVRGYDAFYPRQLTTRTR